MPREVNEKVTIYLDGNGKWRWRHRRGSRVVGASSQGYSNKWSCIQNIRTAFSADYTVTHQTKQNTPNGRMYQQAELTVPGTERKVFVEVLPWEEGS